jgi:hypothetical protein
VSWKRKEIEGRFFNVDVNNLTKVLGEYIESGCELVDISSSSKREGAYREISFNYKGWGMRTTETIERKRGTGAWDLENAVLKIRLDYDEHATKFAEELERKLKDELDCLSIPF